MELINIEFLLKHMQNDPLYLTLWKPLKVVLLLHKELLQELLLLVIQNQLQLGRPVVQGIVIHLDQEVRFVAFLAVLVGIEEPTHHFDEEVALFPFFLRLLHVQQLVIDDVVLDILLLHRDDAVLVLWDVLGRLLVELCLVMQ